MKLQSVVALYVGQGAHTPPGLGYPIIGDSAPKLAGIRGTVHITFPR